MKDQRNIPYYLGLDIGTNSVGWAVTDLSYNLLSFHGKSMWGSRLFDEAETAAERRTFRTARRRNNRKKERIKILESLFADEIAKVDPDFYLRMKESKYYREDKELDSKFALFNDKNYTDADYYKEFPTIYHLRKALIEDEKEGGYDIRLYYLAIHQIMKHRGHFLFGSSKFSIGNSFDTIIDALITAYEEYIGELDFNIEDKQRVRKILTDKTLKPSQKAAELNNLMVTSDSKLKELNKLLVGNKAKLSKIFDNPDLEEIDSFSFKDGKYEENEDEYLQALADQMEVIDQAKNLYDLVLLENIIGDTDEHTKAPVSLSKCNSYDKHKKDLKILKHVLRNPDLCDPQKSDMFLKDKNSSDNYNAYIQGQDPKGRNKTRKRVSQEDFCKSVAKLLQPAFEKMDQGIVSDEYRKELEYLLSETTMGTLMPKQMGALNSVLPYQLQETELNAILTALCHHYPSFKQKDDDGFTPEEKIQKTFKFRIPYYVGPLNDADSQSKGGTGNAWIQKKTDEKIYPWNFEQVVDINSSAEAFIRRMTNKCTYLPKEDVVPKNSLLYQSFMVLNEINNLKVNGCAIDVQIKQKMYHDVFENKAIIGKITLDKLKKYLVRENIITNTDELSGIDVEVKSRLSSYQDFKSVIGDRINSYTVQKDIEEIIEAITLFGDDRKMLLTILNTRYCNEFSKDELKAFSKKRYKDWGRFSKKLLDGLSVMVDPAIGEYQTIIGVLWNTNYNFMEIINSDQYSFKQQIESENDLTKELKDKFDYESLDVLHISPAVKRSVWQTLQIVEEIQKIQKHDPAKVFIEVTRFNGEKKRTKSRKQQLIELYKDAQITERDLVEQLEQKSDSDLRKDALFLYFTQLGKDMYTGERIDIENAVNPLLYDKDHIYPRSKTKDDSRLNNLVLTRTEPNKDKGDKYPIKPNIQEDMGPFWKKLLNKNLITREKYNRLVRTTPLTTDELSDFINRQIVETGQSAKAVKDLLTALLPESSIVTSKAGNVSDFRQKFELVKVRELNDYHHAKDAYLNIVVGNVFDVKFTQSPAKYIKNKDFHYNLYRMYEKDITRGDQVAWISENDKTIGNIKKWYKRNNVLVTWYSYKVTGAFYNQQPVIKGEGQVSFKSSNERLSAEKYGGYNSINTSYFALVESKGKKGKLQKSIEAVPVYLADQVERDKEVLINYLTNTCGLTNPMIIIPVIKKNTLIKKNGYPLLITGKSNKQITVNNAVELCVNEKQELYIKKICNYQGRNQEAKKQKKAAPISEKYDKLSKDGNLALYDLLLEKESRTIYQNRPSNQAATLLKGRDKFEMCNIEDQTVILYEILHLFQCNGVLSDLHEIGGTPKAGKGMLSKTITEKDDYVIINQSPTGLFSTELRIGK